MTFVHLHDVTSPPFFFLEGELLFGSFLCTNKTESGKKKRKKEKKNFDVYKF